MAVGRFSWSSVTLYAFLVQFRFYCCFFDVEAFGKANEMRSDASECAMDWRKDFFYPTLATFPPCGTYHRSHGRRFFSTRVSLYPNSVSTFNLIRLSTSGDINPNPGPPLNSPKCPICERAVAKTHRAIECDICLRWCHIKCGRVNPSEYNKLQLLDHFFWNCPFCELRALPFANASSFDLNLDDDVVSEPDEDVFTTLKTTMGNNKNLKIGHININGLTNKLSEIQFLLKEVEFDILGVTETHLTVDLSNELIRIYGYNTVRRDRSNGLKGGGVVIYYRDNLNISENLKWDIHQDLEAVWINITIRSQSTLLGCLYRPPKSITFYDDLHDLLNKIWIKRKNVILLGDFNCNLLANTADTDQDAPYDCNRMKRILRRFGYVNVIESPTRITANSKSLIDLIIVSPNLHASNVLAGSIDLGISDHHLIFAAFSTRRSNSKPKLITVRNYKDMDNEKFQRSLEEAPWHIVSAVEDVEDSVYLWETMFKDIIESNIKRRNVKVRHKSLPWINTEIRKAMNQRYKCLKAAQGKPHDNPQWDIYRAKRNAVRSMLRKAEASYWIGLFKESSSPKDFWRISNRILGKIKSDKIGPLQDSNNTIISDDRQKANLINNYFIDIAHDLTKNLDPVHLDTTFYINRITPTIENFSLNWDIVRDVLKSINPNKAVGPDNIFPKDLKLAQDSAIQGLLEVFKKSMDCCKFPQQWKESLVTPVFKKGNRLDPNNYRPISLLSTPGKLLEKVVCDSLDDHMLSNGILTDRQWGFRRGYSTESLLLHLTESWGSALDRGHKVGVLFIDFRKAFDCVNHSILTEKLKAVGLAGDMWKWINDYLSNRVQGTSVSGSRSDRIPIRAGVPQGSLLGPRLFASYVNDLPESITSGEVYMYADDTTIYVVGNTVDEITTGLQAVLDQVNSWCLSNRLILHEGKSEAMVLSTTPFIGPLKQLKWGMDTIRYVSSTNCLGVTIDDKLSWSQHVALARSAFNAKVKMLRRINFLCTSILETFYYRIVIPSVLYGIAIWGSGSKLKDLEMIHIRAARLIHKIPNSFGDNDVLSKVGWMPLEYFYKLRILTITYNAYYNLGLREINCLVTKNSNSYNLRKSLNVVLNRPKTELGRRSFAHRSAVAWNALPDNVKDSPNLSIFKYNLKQSKQTVMNINFEKGGNVIQNMKPNFHYY